MEQGKTTGESKNESQIKNSTKATKQNTSNQVSDKK